MSEALELDWADVDLTAAHVRFRDTKNGTDRIAALPEAAIMTLANLPIIGHDDVAAAAWKDTQEVGPSGELCVEHHDTRSRGDLEKRRDGGQECEAGWPAKAEARRTRALYRKNRSPMPKGNQRQSETGAGIKPDPQQRSGRVFRRDDGEPYADRERQSGGQIKTAWATACRRAGIEDATPHTLRHSWASWAYAVTKDPMLLKHEGGWATLSMVERYSHLCPSEVVFEIHQIWGASHPKFGTLPTKAPPAAAKVLA